MEKHYTWTLVFNIDFSKERSQFAYSMHRLHTLRLNPINGQISVYSNDCYSNRICYCFFYTGILELER